MEEYKNTTKTRIKTCGGLGILGALLIVIADILYNTGSGEDSMIHIYIPSLLGVFCFPFWWGGIWVIYQGLKPAGIKWSLFPCIIFAYLVSTVNVSGHALYPYWAAFKSLARSDNLTVVQAAAIAEKTASEYSSSLLAVIQPILEILICIWIIIPIVRGRTFFPRWIILLIPLIPTVTLLGANTIIPGLFEKVGPYIGSGSMVILFSIATIVMLRHEESRRDETTS